MSLTQKIIKNTYYYFLFQLIGFLFPLILTPYIISKIGEEQFGIYALVLGFIGMFGLLDLSLSSSFIIFISRYFVIKDFTNLNRYFNTGFIFYVLFSAVIVAAGFIFAKPLLSLLNIPGYLTSTSIEVFYIGLFIFFVSNAFTIFSSVLISLQKMYVTSIAGIATAFSTTALTFIVLSLGYGLLGIIWAQLFGVCLNSAVVVVSAIRSVPELKIGFNYLHKNPVREMTKFGAQMQISKLASFASEKYDEFLLAYFSVLSNVTYFNVANRVIRTGRLIPFQLITQVAPVASELNSRNETEKINTLFSDTTKYLVLVSIPVFVFVIVFSDLIITTWMGPGYELSSGILKILAAGQLINMTLSAPGNSIIPNLGIPKYQMREGLINLIINIVLSFILIKYYGILGAASGNAIAALIASVYTFLISAKYFKKSKTKLLSEFYAIPVLISIAAGIICFYFFSFAKNYLFEFNGRFSGIIYIVLLGFVFMSIYLFALLKSPMISRKDKIVFAKMIMKLIPINNSKTDSEQSHSYNNELVSIFIVTHNRLEMFKKCFESILSSLNGINYELILIDNASTDGTREFMIAQQKSNDKIKIILNEKNIGINSKSIGAESASGDFIVGVDDDVILFPHDWVIKMICAYKAIPKMGYLASDVVQDETTTGAKHPPEMYSKEIYDNGNVILEIGPTGGWCFMISREVYEKIGKLVRFDDRIFFAEDGDYLNRIVNAGFKYGILSGVKVYHATGEFHNKNFKQVYENKYKDFEKGNSSSYEFKAKFKRMFSINRLIFKIKEYSGKPID